MIRQLSEDVRGRLRTGVALTSVAQCVEELVLNSVDAGATCVAVRVDLQSLIIQVVDNGEGITKEQLPRVGERYSTSKCHSLDDLDHLKYFGYRGEALASLCSASSFMEIVTRPAGSAATYSKCFQKGKALPVTEPSGPRPGTGTTVTARNLLYNLPVRKKSLNEGLELEKIRFRVAGLALMWPLISFSLRDDVTGNVILQTHKCSSILATFSSLFGAARAKRMREIGAETDLFKISGYVSRENYSRKDLQFVFVNRRLVLKSKVHKLLNSVFSKSVLVRRRVNMTDRQNYSPTEEGSPSKIFERYAVYVINIECPFNIYDITFDPAKTLVEFHHWPELNSIIETTLLKFFREENLLSVKELEEITTEPDGIASSRDGEGAASVPDLCETDDPFAGSEDNFDEELCNKMQRSRFTRGISVHCNLNSLFSHTVRRRPAHEEKEDFDDLDPSSPKKRRQDDSSVARIQKKVEQIPQNSFDRKINRNREYTQTSSGDCHTSDRKMGEKFEEENVLVATGLQKRPGLKGIVAEQDDLGTARRTDHGNKEITHPHTVGPADRVPCPTTDKQYLNERLHSQTSLFSESLKQICLPQEFAYSSLSHLRTRQVEQLQTPLQSSLSVSSARDHPVIQRPVGTVLEVCPSSEKLSLSRKLANQKKSKFEIDMEQDPKEIVLPPVVRPTLMRCRSLDAEYLGCNGTDRFGNSRHAFGCSKEADTFVRASDDIRIRYTGSDQISESRKMMSEKSRCLISKPNALPSEANTNASAKTSGLQKLRSHFSRVGHQKHSVFGGKDKRNNTHAISEGPALMSRHDSISWSSAVTEKVDDTALMIDSWSEKQRGGHAATCTHYVAARITEHSPTALDMLNKNQSISKAVKLCHNPPELSCSGLSASTRRQSNSNEVNLKSTNVSHSLSGRSKPGGLSQASKLAQLVRRGKALNSDDSVLRDKETDTCDRFFGSAGVTQCSYDTGIKNQPHCSFHVGHPAFQRKQECQSCGPCHKDKGLLAEYSSRIVRNTKAFKNTGNGLNNQIEENQESSPVMFRGTRFFERSDIEFANPNLSRETIQNSHTLNLFQISQSTFSDSSSLSRQANYNTLGNQNSCRNESLDSDSPQDSEGRHQTSGLATLPHKQNELNTEQDMSAGESVASSRKSSTNIFDVSVLKPSASEDIDRRQRSKASQCYRNISVLFDKRGDRQCIIEKPPQETQGLSAVHSQGFVLQQSEESNLSSKVGSGTVFSQVLDVAQRDSPGSTHSKGFSPGVSSPVLADLDDENYSNNIRTPSEESENILGSAFSTASYVDHSQTRTGVSQMKDLSSSCEEIVRIENGSLEDGCTDLNDWQIGNFSNMTHGQKPKTGHHVNQAVIVLQTSGKDEHYQFCQRAYESCTTEAGIQNVETEGCYASVSNPLVESRFSAIVLPEASSPVTCLNSYDHQSDRSLQHHLPSSAEKTPAERLCDVGTREKEMLESLPQMEKDSKYELDKCKKMGIQNLGNSEAEDCVGKGEEPRVKTLSAESKSEIKRKLHGEETDNIKLKVAKKHTVSPESSNTSLVTSSSPPSSLSVQKPVQDDKAGTISGCVSLPDSAAGCVFSSEQCEDFSDSVPDSALANINMPASQALSSSTSDRNVSSSNCVPESVSGSRMVHQINSMTDYSQMANTQSTDADRNIVLKKLTGKFNRPQLMKDISSSVAESLVVSSIPDGDGRAATMSSTQERADSYISQTCPNTASEKMGIEVFTQNTYTMGSILSSLGGSGEDPVHKVPLTRREPSHSGRKSVLAERANIRQHRRNPAEPQDGGDIPDEPEWSGDIPEETEWIPVTDSSTGRTVYMNSSSGHTLTQEQWKKREFIQIKTGFYQRKLDEKLPNFQSNEAESAPSPNLLKSLLSSHYEMEEENSLSKWREGSKTGLKPESICNTVVTVADILKTWENPVFKPADKMLQTVPVSQASNVARCFFHPIAFTKPMLAGAKVIGQLDNKFLACLIMEDRSVMPSISTDIHGRGEEGLVVLFDQHAAHERVRLEQLLSDVYEETGGNNTRDCERRRIKRCDVKPPRTMDLSQEDVRLMQSFREEYERIGVQFEVVKERRDRVLAHTIPACMAQREANDRKRGKDPLSYQYLEIMIREHNQLLLSTAGAKRQLPQQVHRLLATHACKGAIKFGDALALSTCRELLSSLSACDLPFQCAHGRPSIAPLISLTQLRQLASHKKRPPNLLKLRHGISATQSVNK